MDTPRDALFNKVAGLPQQPGVYQFFDSQKKLLYIGKATNLRARVQSYFRQSTDLSPAKRFMVAQIMEMQYIVVDTEPEALLLETTLIKQHKPPYNIVMKDDKNFQYIHITNDMYPRIETVRRVERSPGRVGRYFGPYISGRAVHRTLALLKSIFHYCETPPLEKNGRIIFPKRACLDYHLDRCVGPCAQAISPQEYTKIFDQIAQFLQGYFEPIERYVRREMQRAASRNEFEKAARFRDQLQAIESLMMEQKVVSPTRENADYLSLARQNSHAAVNVFTVRRGKMIHQEVFFLQHTKGQTNEEVMSAFRDQYYAQTMTRPQRIYDTSETRRGRHRRLLAMGVTNAEQALERYVQAYQKREQRGVEGVRELAAALGMRAEDLGRIEIYDNSNIQGKYPVASMVVFEHGLPEPAQYRKFKIRTVVGPDDFASMREIMDRRLRHLPERQQKNSAEQGRAGKIWPRPGLIIIDGGKGQLSAATSVLDILQLDIPIISLAKREEEIFFPNNPEPLRLPKDSPAMYFIQRMRDEAHRFAIGFYRSRHLKDFLS